MKRYRTVPRRVLGAALIALLSLVVAPRAALAAPSSAVTMSGGNATPSIGVARLLSHQPSATAPGDTPNLTITDSSACPKYQAPSAGPYVDICSPVYEGKSEGPWDSRVVITGGNFKGDTIQGIYLLLPFGNTVTSLSGPCSNSNPLCAQFTNDSEANGFKGWGDPFYAQFDWTFPEKTLPAKSSFSIVVTYVDSHSKLTQTNPSATAFKLLSDQQPCIVAAVEKPTLPPDGKCEQSVTVQAFQNELWIGGTGWLPDATNTNASETVTVLTCPGDKAQSCASGDSSALKTTSFDVPPQSQAADDPANGTPGDFLEKVQIAPSGNDTKVYNIVAYATLTNSDSNNNADKALHFGDTSDTPRVTLAITPPPCLSLSNASCAVSSESQAVTGSQVTIYGQHWEPHATVDVTLQSSPCSTVSTSASPATVPNGTTPGDSHSGVIPPGASQSGAFMYVYLAGASHRSIGGNAPTTVTAKVDDRGNLAAKFTIPRITGKNARLYVCGLDRQHKEWAYPQAGSKSGLFLTVKPAPVPSPLQKLLLVLGAFFALVSLCAFVVTTPKRAATPQTVGRR